MMLRISLPSNSGSMSGRQATWEEARASRDLRMLSRLYIIHTVVVTVIPPYSHVLGYRRTCNFWIASCEKTKCLQGHSRLSMIWSRSKRNFQRAIELLWTVPIISGVDLLGSINCEGGNQFVAIPYYRKSIITSRTVHVSWQLVMHCPSECTAQFYLFQNKTKHVLNTFIHKIYF